jgi:phage repressor protein C with HTH and peptisase S24 domain
MSSLNERLRQARREAGFETAADAARAFGWKSAGYIHHENGTRGVKPDLARRYAKAFKKPVEWLLYGESPKRWTQEDPPRAVPLVGYVAAGSRAHFFDDLRDSGEPIPAPPGASEDTVAVEIRGDSLGPAFERAIVFYDDVKRPVTDDLLGRLCVVGLIDGRIMVKTLAKSKSRRGLFHLTSNNAAEPPIFDAEVEWAARVLDIRLPK